MGPASESGMRRGTRTDGRYGTIGPRKRLFVVCAVVTADVGKKGIRLPQRRTVPKTASRIDVRAGAQVPCSRRDIFTKLHFCAFLSNTCEIFAPDKCIFIPFILYLFWSSGIDMVIIFPVLGRLGFIRQGRGNLVGTWRRACRGKKRWRGNKIMAGRYNAVLRPWSGGGPDDSK